MKRRLPSFAILAALLLFMIYPLMHVLSGAFFFKHHFTLRFFAVMFGTETYREALYNSVNIALCVTAICSLIAYPIALILARFKLPGATLLHALLLAPLIVPPFVGVLGVRQLLGRFGSLNMMLLHSGLISEPLDWLAGGSALGIVLLQVVHLVPILYLSIRASLENAHVSLEEAATMCGASRLRVLRLVVIPLSLPGWFAGATLVFISSFTDLGTPLLFEYREVVAVQIFNMLSDLHENPVGYSFVVFTCMLSITLFTLSHGAVFSGSFASSGRNRESRLYRSLSRHWEVAACAGLLAYATLACIPQAFVVLVACSKDWFMSVVPQQFTLQHFQQVLAYPLTSRSLIISTCLSLAASFLTILVGFMMAHTIVRGRGVLRHVFEALSLLPLAIPGIVFAFGFIGAFSGTILDNRLNPFPLLIIAYSVRRLPALVRSVCAGLQEASRSMEEAALMVGAHPFTITRRITMPLIRRHLIVGAILTFTYSMIEVSDSLLLALETKFYPISKTIYFLTGRPDGFEVASALGVLVMVVMLLLFYVAERVSAKSSKISRLSVLVIVGLLPLSTAAADDKLTANQELVVVSPHWQGIREEFSTAFRDQWRARTGQDVVFRWLDVGGVSDIVKYVKGQFAQTPNGIGIDLVFGGGSDSHIELEAHGLLAAPTIAREVVRAIPSDLAGVPLYSPQLTWFANALSAFGILYNKAAIERLGLPTPSMWSDLADPRYRGYVGAGDPRKSGSMHAMYEIILQGYGWEQGWTMLQRIARNVRHFSGGASQIGKEVALGELIYGIAIDTYAGDIIRTVGHERLGYTLPRDFAAINGDAIGMLKGAPNPVVGSAFIEFLLSEAGQRIWFAKKGQPGGPRVFELGKLSVLPSLYGNVESASVVTENPFSMKNVLTYDAATAASRWTLVNDLFGVFIIDLHQRIARVADVEQLRGIPISELASQQLLSSGSWGSDQGVRTEMLQKWSAIARQNIPESPTPLGRFKALPGIIFCLLLIALVVRRAFSRTLTKTGPRNFSVK